MIINLKLSVPFKNICTDINGMEFTRGIDCQLQNVQLKKSANQ